MERGAGEVRYVILLCQELLTPKRLIDTVGWRRRIGLRIGLS
jgi:hypothetical protein